MGLGMFPPPNLSHAFGGGLLQAAPAIQGQPQWVFVRRRFERMIENLAITEGQAEDGKTKHEGVVACLSRAYWGASDGATNRLLVGSWGKRTRVRPPRDIDVFFLPPLDVFHRFNARSGNKQSQLLQEIAQVVRETYPQTRIRADGQVVVVGFNTYQIELVPAFPVTGGGYFICDTNDGGRWKHVDPEAERYALDASDTALNGNARKITRILKQWQRHCDVPIKSFQLEAIVKDALPTIMWGGYSEFWFDWVVRDVLAHLISRANGGFWMPGCISEWISFGDAWLSKAQTAHARSLKACEFERYSMDYEAGAEWQKIFGTMIPVQAG